MVKRYSRKSSKKQYKVLKRRTRKNSRKRSKKKNTRKKLRGGAMNPGQKARLILDLTDSIDNLEKKLWGELTYQDKVSLEMLGYEKGKWPANVAIKKIYPFPFPTAVARLYDLGFELKDIKGVLGDETDDEKKIMEAQNKLFRKRGSRFTKQWAESRILFNKSSLGTRSYDYGNIQGSGDKGIYFDYQKKDFLKLLEPDILEKLIEQNDKCISYTCSMTEEIINEILNENFNMQEISLKWENFDILFSGGGHYIIYLQLPWHVFYLEIKDKKFRILSLWAELYTFLEYSQKNEFGVWREGFDDIKNILEDINGTELVSPKTYWEYIYSKKRSYENQKKLFNIPGKILPISDDIESPPPLLQIRKCYKLSMKA